MTFLPIVGRELRVAARRPATFWTRTIIALGAIGIGTLLFLASLDTAPQSVSRRIFIGLMVLAAGYCLMAGRRFTADCISEEKREGTLGLLFLTDLKGYDIILGKLSATSLNGFYGLLAALPILAVPILMGGITSGEFWRVALVLLNTFFFSLSVGILASAITREARRAMGANLLLVLAISGLPALLALALAFFLPAQRLFEPLMFSCPIYSLVLADDSLYRSHLANFWCSLATVHLITWLLLAVSSRVVPRCWQERAPRASARGRLQEVSSKQLGATQFRRRSLDQNAFYWLASRPPSKPLQVWALMLFIMLWWIGATAQFGSLWLTEYTSGTNLATAIMLNVALKLWIGLEACRQLAEDRKNGAFELLFSTGLEVRDVIRGQWLALKRQFLWPSVFAAVVVLLFMVAATRHAPDEHLALTGFWLGAIGLFVVDVTALVWTAMSCALSCRTPNHAIVMAITRIILLPTLLLALVTIFANLITAGVGGSSLPFSFWFCCWIGFGLIADLVYGVSAWRRLRGSFRRLASEGRAGKAATASQERSTGSPGLSATGSFARSYPNVSGNRSAETLCPK